MQTNTTSGAPIAAASDAVLRARISAMEAMPISVGSTKKTSSAFIDEVAPEW